MYLVVVVLVRNPLYIMSKSVLLTRSPCFSRFSAICDKTEGERGGGMQGGVTLDSLCVFLLLLMCSLG